VTIVECYVLDEIVQLTINKLLGERLQIEISGSPANAEMNKINKIIAGVLSFYQSPSFHPSCVFPSLPSPFNACYSAYLPSTTCMCELLDVPSAFSKVSILLFLSIILQGRR